MPPDPRRVVGGTCWARAEAVTHDAKRIYGASLAKMWVKGTVLEVKSVLRDQAKRATTYINANYQVGNRVYTKMLPLSTTKTKLPEDMVDGNRSSTANNNGAADPLMPPLDGQGGGQGNLQMVVDQEVLFWLQAKMVEIGMLEKQMPTSMAK